jgi:hypothetical protein
VHDQPARHAWAAAPRGDATIPLPRVPHAAKVLAAVWLGLVMAGSVGIWRYKLTPGASARLEQRFPTHGALTLAAHGPTLILFAHPRCPCTRASLAELRRVLSPFTGKVAAHVVFFHADPDSGGFAATDTYKLAQSIPGVVVSLDPDGRDAERFGVTTSGHVVLYGDNGQLLFSGGITPARGHEGDSPGRQRLSELLARETTQASAKGEATTIPVVGAVYGCSLRGRP